MANEQITKGNNFTSYKNKLSSEESDGLPATNLEYKQTVTQSR